MTLKALGELIERTTGLALDRGGVSTALDRYVTERMTELKLARIEDFIAIAASPSSAEQHRLIDAITVPHTWFYRDPEQLQMIAKILVGAPAGRIEIWVAGCATGEEAYTLAMIGRHVGRDVLVYATDINETALAVARRGVYSALAVRDVPELERRWLIPQDNRFSVDPELRKDVEFARHNLVDFPPSAPTRGGWDLVVCRNVLIYFAQHTVARMLDRFAYSLREGGSLVVGASEVVFEPPSGLELVPLGNRLVLRRPMPGAPTEGRPARRFATPPMGVPIFNPALTPALGIPTLASASGRPPMAPGRPATVSPAPPMATSTPATAPSPPATSPSASATAPSMLAGASSAPATAPAPSSRPPTLPPAAASPPREPPRPIADDDLVVALTRGHALFERGEVAAAIPVYEELTRSRADNAEPWLFLGIARFVHGDVSEAAKALRSSLCLAPTLWPADFYLARAYERMGRGAEALHHYDLVAANEQKPLSLRSVSAVINELRALRYDFQTAARRVFAERSTPPRRTIK